MKKIEQEIRNYVELLKEVVPLPYKRISVRLVDPDTLEKDDGEVDIVDDSCYIRINEELCIPMQKETLLHEWAHALGDFVLNTLRLAGLNWVADFLHDHGLIWGICYGYAYQNSCGVL